MSRDYQGLRRIGGREVALPKGAVGAFSKQGAGAVIHAEKCQHARKGNPFPPDQGEIDDLEARGYRVRVADCAK